jgi:hypothetical protein
VFTSVDAPLGSLERRSREAIGEDTAAPTPPTAPGPEAAGFGQAMLSLYERAKNEADYTRPTS